ncbi:unnamed protein product [Peniophora sp. CBMAI 1063]|nr:unnamed protein product [Peniophora sp. CBMAI 1063]
MDTIAPTYACIFAAILVPLIWLSTSKRSNVPGPRPLPVIGNLLDLLSAGDPWGIFTTWKVSYGDVVGLRVFGTNIIVLNSMQAFNELLNKRASKYSHRPVFTVVCELMKMGKSMPLRDYDEEWREMRRISHNALGTQPVKQYHRMQEDMAALFARDVLDEPSNFRVILRMYSSRIILSLTYGLSAQEADDAYVEHAENTMNIIRESAVVGAYLCDLLPMMKHLPSWLPFQRRAARGRAMVHRMVTEPFLRVQRDMSEGKARPSLARDFLNQNEGALTETSYERLLWTAASMYAAGAESSYATTLTFILAMTLYPGSQQTAQQELDNVLGFGSLPTIADRERLPYIQALVKETMRWHPMLPLSFPRRTAQSDEYRGFTIPANTIVIPNVWSVAFEPNPRHPPEDFIPERFLDIESMSVDPASWAFGFGRRICPGKLLGENNIFILISTLLVSFKILPPEGGYKRKPMFVADLGSFPEPFDCQIVPRSQVHELNVHFIVNHFA